MYNVKDKISYLDSDCVNPYLGIYPCRRCANCLAQRSRLWSMRILNEAKDSLEVVRFTLTYTDEMLISSDWGAKKEMFLTDCPVQRPFKMSDEMRKSLYLLGVDTSKMVFDEPFKGTCYTLSKKDIQKYIKRLRINTNVKFKYLVKGEYGDMNGRPHYHCLIFVSKENKDFNLINFRNDICNAWNNALYKENGDSKEAVIAYPQNAGKFFKVNPLVNFEPFDNNLSQYCAKYTTKDSVFKLFEVLGIKDSKLDPSSHVPEFMLSSTHFGVNQYIIGQCKILRKRLLDLSEICERLSDEDFFTLFQKGTTFYWDNSSTFLPNFLKVYVFRGYYRYKPCPFPVNKFLRDRWHEKNKIFERHKVWTGTNEDEIFIKSFAYMVERYNEIKLERRINEIQTLENLDRLYYAHIEKINKTNNARIQGALKKRLEKIAERRKFINS